MSSELKCLTFTGHSTLRCVFVGHVENSPVVSCVTDIIYRQLVLSYYHSGLLVSDD